MSKSQHKGAGPSLRLLRVAENVRHAISAILARGDVQDPDLGHVSVTVSEVRLSSDMRHATIFVMPLGGDKTGKIIEALNRKAGFIRGAMGKMVHMKFMPQLKFKQDESFDEASHIEALLRSEKVMQDLVKDDTPSGEDQDD
mgnify:CR=1 FL=1|tara:strand:- start:790 stop:1215 length:426 start_codon:yes stop_codon:yes gene_type:complete